MFIKQKNRILARRGHLIMSEKESNSVFMGSSLSFILTVFWLDLHIYQVWWQLDKNCDLDRDADKLLCEHTYIQAFNISSAEIYSFF